MNTVQLVLGLSAAALPTIAVLVGILLNRNDVSRLDSRISALEISLRGEMVALQTSLRGEMVALQTSLRGEMVALQASLRGEMALLRSQFHSDIMMLVSSDEEQDQRITRLENR